MPNVHMPDGTTVAFPDEMPPDQIKAMILQKFPGAGGPQEKPDTDQAMLFPGTSMPVSMVKNIATNLPSSAAEFAGNMIQPIIHPIDTATSIKDLGLGVLQKLGLASGTEHVQNADAVGKFLMNRYGGLENIKNTLETDPVGLAADLSVILTGGGTLGGRAPGIVGKVSRIASEAGRAVDPLNVVAPTLRGIGNLTAEGVGLGTGTGAQPIKIAAKAGAEGGDAAKAFRENITRTEPMEAVAQDARTAVTQMRKERGEIYREGMAKIGADTEVLDFEKIDNAVNKVGAVKTYKGQNLSPKTQGIREEILQAVEDWKNLDPKEFHTAEGLDALKQKIGDIRDATQYGTPERVVADGVYNSVKKTIIEQAPEYAKVMKGYEEASNLIRDIEKTLSTNPNASVDTALRKLQSVLRDNVNTNYGRRADLAKFLVDAGAPYLMEKLAGQALNPVMPRGLAKLSVALGAELGAAGLGAAGAGLSGAGIGALATLPFMSPRLMGNAAYLGGLASRPINALPLRTLGRAGYQLGRLPSQ